ncbi:MAG TPA: hypothetical protein VN940_02460 [Candidatus Dormibacteraeota bacterium]|nr:hypothetical protein [Candidatus Dormibacteraeota bacterium]
MAIQVVERDLERLHQLWEDGLSEAYRSYLEAVDGFEPSAQPRLALAAALVEVGVRLQGLGGRAAAPPSLLMGDLCLARASRLLADAAPQSIQVAFARAIEEMSSAAAAEQTAPHTRELLLRAFEAR